MRSRPVVIIKKENSGDCFRLVADSDEERKISVLMVGILPADSNTTKIQYRLIQRKQIARFLNCVADFMADLRRRSIDGIY